MGKNLKTCRIWRKCHTHPQTSKDLRVPHQKRSKEEFKENYCPENATLKWCRRNPKALQKEVGVRSPRGWSGRALDISRGVQGRDRGTRRLGGTGLILTERISSARAHCSAFTFGIRAGWCGGEGTPASGPSAAGRREAGQGRGGDEVAAAVAAVAPRPGPAVQPGSRPSSS